MAAILSAILEFVIGFVSNVYTHVRCHYAQFSDKKRSLHINKWLSYGQILCFMAAILSVILEFAIEFMSNFYN